MARIVKICIDTNVLLVFFNHEPDKYASCLELCRIVFERNIQVVISTVTMLELAAILTAQGRYSEAETIVSTMHVIPQFLVTGFRNQWILKTARLKKDNQLAMADAIIITTALETNCSQFITFDSDFQKLSNITIIHTPQQFIDSV